MRLDLHNHSEHSFDCRSKVEEIKKAAKESGITYIAITDHDVMKVKDPFFIPGCEFSTELGHVIGLFLKKEIKTRKAAKLMNEIRKQGGIVYIPHPIRKGSGLLEKSIIDHATLIDAIEVYNPDNTPYGNKVAYNLATKLGKCMLTGSDSHTLSAIGRGSSRLKSRIRSKSHLKELIRKNELRIVLDQEYNPENCRSIKYFLLVYGEAFLRKTHLYDLKIVRKAAKTLYKLTKKHILKQEYR